MIFRQNAEWHFCPTSRPASAVVRHRRPSQSEQLEYLENVSSEDRQFLLIRGNQLHTASGYDVDSCFHSAFIEVRKNGENVASVALGRIVWCSVLSAQPQLAGFLFYLMLALMT